MDVSTYKISLIVIACFINVAVYANTITPDPTGHWYVGGFLGAQLAANGNTEIPSIASKPSLTSEPVYDKGLVLSVNVGYKFRESFRIEGEFVRQDLPINKINNAIGFGTVTNVSNSHTELFSLFVNSYHDFRLSQHWMPYLGVGIGYVAVRNTIKPTSPISVAQNIFFTEKELNYYTFGYQGILGVDYQLADNFILSLNYKYFSTFEKQVAGQTNLGMDGYQTKQKITTNTVLFGVKYFFA